MSLITIKQELFLRQRPVELDRLIEIAKVQSTEASNRIEGIITTNSRLKQLVADKTTPKNRDEEEILGYRNVLNLIHESYDAIPVRKNYILQLHKELGTPIDKITGIYSSATLKPGCTITHGKPFGSYDSVASHNQPPEIPTEDADPVLSVSDIRIIDVYGLKCSIIFICRTSARYQ